MTKATKDTVFSVVVLFAITAVCVALLALANEFLSYKPTLDNAMASHLYSICQTGESEQTAIDSFEILEVDKEINEINKTHGRTYKAKVIAVYRATAGEKAGYYIVQASSKGRDGDVIMLTAFDKDNKIVGIKCYSQMESYWAKIDETKFNNLVGKEGEVKSDDIDVSTGATKSLTAVSNAVSLSYQTAKTLSGGNA